jgi:hypothetical protein
MLAIDFRDTAVIADRNPSPHALRDPADEGAKPSPVRFLPH